MNRSVHVKLSCLKRFCLTSDILGLAGQLSSAIELKFVKLSSLYDQVLIFLLEKLQPRP
jgi:hypothetical protein